MDALEMLHTRTAAPRLVEPAPDSKEMEQVYKAALRAPDHGMLRPWKFLVIEGEGRQKLGELFVECMQPEDEARQNKLLNAPLRAPMLIVAASIYQEHDKVPRIEQVESTAAAVQNMSLALHALGYASIWRTGPVAFDDKIKQGLGLKPEDEIVAYLYVGTPTVKQRPIPEHNIKDFVENWGT